VREQLAAAAPEAGDAPKQVASGVVESTLPPPGGPAASAPPSAHPPTWAQEVLGRLLRRTGGQP
jgi:hypothetical protein